MYTTAGAVELVDDLAHLPRGHAVASVLRSALALAPGDLERLADAHPGVAVRHRRLNAAAPARLRPDPLDSTPPGDEAGGLRTRAARDVRLRGGIEDLDHLIRHDVLDWTWVRHGETAVQDPAGGAAADVLVDAATAHFLHDPAQPRVGEALCAPLVASGVDVRAAVGARRPDAVTQVLAEVSRVDAATRDRWRCAALVLPVADRSEALRRAVGVLELSGRVRDGLDVQLCGLAAFRRAGFGTLDAATVWPAVSHALLAGLVGDLLAAADVTVLTRAWATLLD